MINTTITWGSDLHNQDHVSKGEQTDKEGYWELIFTRPSLKKETDEIGIKNYVSCNFLKEKGIWAVFEIILPQIEETFNKYYEGI